MIKSFRVFSSLVSVDRLIFPLSKAATRLTYVPANLRPYRFSNFIFILFFLFKKISKFF